MPSDFLEQLSERIILGDGAMGTQLQALSSHADGCLDALNIDEEPAARRLVSEVHESYRDAGAEILQANTFGANAVKLARFALEEKVRDICLQGALIAREVAGDDLFVAGSIGPMEFFEEAEAWSPGAIETAFREQMEALVEGGVDILVLETFLELEQASIAVRVAASFGLPVVLQIGGVQEGRTSTGIDVVTFAKEMREIGADVVGSNCRSPFDILRTTKTLAGALDCPLSAQPNAGVPEIDRGRIVYSIRLEDFVRYSERLLDTGANLIGGCCGTTPEHISALKNIVDGRRPIDRKVTRVHAAPEQPVTAPEPPQLNRIDAVFNSGAPLISVEIRPSRDLSLTQLMEGTRQVVKAGATLLDVPDNAGAMVGIDPMVTACYLQQNSGLPTIMHLNSTSRNLIALQSYLLGCWHSGLHGILAITGDHPNVGDHDKFANRITDLKSSVQLIQLLDHLNQGRLFNETPIDSPCGFKIGAGVNPSRNIDPQIRWLKRKVEAGATFAFTQPVYLKEHAQELYERTESLGIKILTGILPVSSIRNAEFLNSGRIPGISVPDSVLEKFFETGSREEARQLGLRLAEEVITGLEGIAHGFYFILPFGKTRYEDTADLVRLASQVPQAK